MRQRARIVQRTDGTGRDLAPGAPGGLRDYPYRDRLFSGTRQIYDARADVTVTFEGAKVDASGGRQWSGGAGVIFWRQSDGVVTVNLAAVP